MLCRGRCGVSRSIRRTAWRRAATWTRRRRRDATTRSTVAVRDHSSSSEDAPSTLWPASTAPTVCVRESLELTDGFAPRNAYTYRATVHSFIICPRRKLGIKRYRDSSVCLSVRLSVQWRSCPRREAVLGYRHAGCLQLGHQRCAPADPSEGGRRSAASRTATAGAYRLAPPGR